MEGQGSHSGGHPTGGEEADRVLEPGLTARPEASPWRFAPLSPHPPVLHPPCQPGQEAGRAWPSDS